jgi:hypothetical protein
MKTNEGSFQYEHTLDHVLEFFSKAGSIFEESRYFYHNNEDIISLFQRAWITDKELTMKALFWLRDCRGGAGNRSGFRKCLKWLAEDKENYKWVCFNLLSVPLYGRWDDLRVLFNTYAESIAADTWAYNIYYKNDFLASKWAKRTDIPIYLKLKKSNIVKNVGEFRKLLVKNRKGIIESKMCSNQWNTIDYEHVPSIAMARYNNAFEKNDTVRFNEYKKEIKNGNKKINASVLFPHDCVRTARFSYNNKDIANAQFDALPNYIDTDKKIMVLCDSSGSMDFTISGSVRAIDISMGLSLYTSSRVNKNNPFYKKFIAFQSESEFISWENYNFFDAVNSDNIFNGAIGATRIDIALDKILNTAKFFNLKDYDLPDMLLICSDMQFSQGSNSDETEVERSLKKWDKAGYKRPYIVYWNFAPYYGSPSTKDNKNICLVSGFSPSILKSILECKNFDPVSIMIKTLEKYEIVKPI